jgi:hypothetical protein
VHSEAYQRFELAHMGLKLFIDEAIGVSAHEPTIDEAKVGEGSLKGVRRV